MIKLHWMMILKTIVWWWTQVYNEFKGYEKTFKFKIVKVMKFTLGGGTPLYIVHTLAIMTY